MWICVNFPINNNCNSLCHFHTFLAKTVAWTQPGETHSKAVVAAKIFMEK